MTLIERWTREYTLIERLGGTQVPIARGAIAYAVERMEQSQATTTQGAVTDRDALAKHLEYALDALEGNPWTGWNTDDARAILGRARGQ